ncbi:MAG: hypothetical protein ABW148_00835 [Sedimenticola sp.]
MSDGPHFSLNLRRRWKKMAEACDNEASSLAECSAALSDALAADFQQEHGYEVVGHLRDALIGEQGQLFPDIDIDSIRGHVAGNDLADRCVDYIDMASVEGGSLNERTIELGCARALEERTNRNARSIEEHYIRESKVERSQHMSEKLQKLINTIPFLQIARELIDPKRSGWKTKRTKQTDLDVGPGL